MWLSIDEIIKISHTYAMFERWRANHSQRFQLTLEVGPWSKDQVIVIPYPTVHQQQTVTNLQWNTDGQAVDHHGCVVIHHGTQATVTATIGTQPFQTTASQVANQSTIRQCYEQVMTQLQYGAPIPGLYSLNDALTLPEVDCGGFSVYLLALLKQQGITARLVAGFWAGYSSNVMHAWAEALLPDGHWLPLDASTDWLRQRRRTTKLGGFGSIGSDRIVISVGADHMVRDHNTEYPVGMLQLPMALETAGTVTYLPNITQVHTQRI